MIWCVALERGGDFFLLFFLSFQVFDGSFFLGLFVLFFFACFFLSLFLAFSLNNAVSLFLSLCFLYVGLVCSSVRGVLLSSPPSAVIREIDFWLHELVRAFQTQERISGSSNHRRYRRALFSLHLSVNWSRSGESGRLLNTCRPRAAHHAALKTRTYLSPSSRRKKPTFRGNTFVIAATKLIPPTTRVPH